MDNGSFGDIGAVDVTDMPQQSVTYPSPAHDVKFKMHFDRPDALRCPVIDTQEQTIQQIPGYCSTTIVVDTDLQPVVALPEETIADGRGGTDIHIVRNPVERKLYNVNHS